MKYSIHKLFLLIYLIFISVGTLNAQQSQTSVHQQQYKKYADQSFEQELPGGPETADPLLKPKQAVREVFGFHPYWMETAWADYRFDLLTTIAYFGVEIDGSGNIVESRGWPVTSLISRAHQHGVRVVLTVILFDPQEIARLLDSTFNRQNLISNVLESVGNANADGVNIDFELVPENQRHNLTAFMQDLAETFHSEIPGSHVSMAVPAIDWSNAFDADALAEACDGLFIMGYDYHWGGSGSTGPVSPLYGYNGLNLSNSVSDYLTETNNNRDKLILGLPWYGYEWESNGPEPGSSTRSDASAKTYSQAADLAQIHESLRLEPAGQIPWYRYAENSSWYQGWYDDSLSLALKYDMALRENLSGIGFWALGYSDGAESIWGGIADYLGTDLPELPTQPEEIQLIAAYPNPFSELVTVRNRSPQDFGGSLSIHVYDLSGRRIQTLLSNVSASNFQEVVWDGQTDAGKFVANGIYFIRAESRFMNQTLKVTYLR